MTPNYYIDTIVEPTVAEYAQDRDSVRRAFLACVAAFHTIDYLSLDESVPTIRQRARAECPSFLLIDRVAHAFKHSETGHVKGPVVPLKADQVQSRPPAIPGLMMLGLSVLGDANGGVSIGGAMGSELLPELRQVISYFRSKVS